MTRTLEHLLEQVADIAPLVRQQADEADRTARLDPAVVEAWHERDLLNVLTPLEFGGGGLSLGATLELIEATAAVDASAGWTYAIYVGSPIFAAQLSKQACETLMADPRALVCGTLGPAGRAVRVGGGYRFTGVAPVCSGAWNAPWVMMGGIVFEDERPVMTESGGPEIVHAVIPMEQAERLDTWNPVGMRGTGSIDCRITDAFVPEGFTFRFFGWRPTEGPPPFGRIPLAGQIGAPLAAVAVGCAFGAIEAFRELVNSKLALGSTETLSRQPTIQAAFGEAAGLAQAARATLHEAANGIWELGMRDQPIDDQVLARTRASIVTAVRLARQSVEVLKLHAGTGATNLGSRFGRAWRDIDMIPAHIMFSPNRLEVAGRVMFGFPAMSPVI